MRAYKPEANLNPQAWLLRSKLINSLIYMTKSGLMYFLFYKLRWVLEPCHFVLIFQSNWRGIPGFHVAFHHWIVIYFILNRMSSRDDLYERI